MKTSVIEVHDMLSVLSVDEVEKRIGEVPGVESVTVNFAAGNATTRYDETRLKIADIRSSVRQRGYEDTAPAAPVAGHGHDNHATMSAPPATSPPENATPTPIPVAAPQAAAPVPASAKPESVSDSAAAMPPDPAGHEGHDKATRNKGA